MSTSETGATGSSTGRTSVTGRTASGTGLTASVMASQPRTPVSRIRLGPSARRQPQRRQDRLRRRLRRREVPLPGAVRQGQRQQARQRLPQREPRGHGCWDPGTEGGGFVGGAVPMDGCSAGAAQPLPAMMRRVPDRRPEVGAELWPVSVEQQFGLRCAFEETSAPRCPPHCRAALDGRDREEIRPPNGSDWCELSASAAGADTASQAIAAAPAKRAGRTGRGAERQSRMVMLNTPQLTE